MPVNKYHLIARILLVSVYIVKGKYEGCRESKNTLPTQLIFTLFRLSWKLKQPSSDSSSSAQSYKLSKHCPSKIFNFLSQHNQIRYLLNFILLLTNSTHKTLFTHKISSFLKNSSLGVSMYKFFLSVKFGTLFFY